MRTKVLMVCLGNICRSPLAEGILKSKVDSDKVLVDSAGTAGYHIGSSPDRRSIAVAQRHNIDISGQSCRILTREDLDNFDLIYAMDHSNYSDIISLTADPELIKKVKLILDETNSEYQEVPDPYYGGERGFELVFKLIDEACGVIASRIS